MMQILVAESRGVWLWNRLFLVAESYDFGCGIAEIWLRNRRNMVAESDFIPSKVEKKKQPDRQGFLWLQSSPPSCSEIHGCKTKKIPQGSQRPNMFRLPAYAHYSCVPQPRFLHPRLLHIYTPLPNHIPVCSAAANAVSRLTRISAC